MYLDIGAAAKGREMGNGLNGAAGDYWVERWRNSAYPPRTSVLIS
jgi:hypothetical protein